MRSRSFLFAVVAPALLAGTVAAGPFHLTLPAPALAGRDEAAFLAQVAEQLGRKVHDLRLRDGHFECLAGGEGPRALVRLSDFAAAVTSAGASLDGVAGDWILPAQELGLAVSAAGEDGAIERQELERVLASFAPGGVKVKGVVLAGAKFVVVVGLERDAGLAALRAHLAAGGVRLDDLVFGHWKAGFGIDEGPGHSHRNGARRR